MKGAPLDRRDVLSTAADLISGDRAAQYRDAYDTHRSVAEMWGALLYHDDVDVQINASTVALMLICLKVVRAAKNPEYADSWVDIAGYAALGAEMAGKK